MRYHEIIETTGDSEQLRIAAQKKVADSQMKAAKHVKQKAKQAELILRKRNSADAFRKLNTKAK